MKKVMVAGTFDIVHPGHLHFFEQAKRYGDHLSVVVAHDDRSQKRLKFNQQERCWALDVLSMVDTVVKGNDTSDIFSILQMVEPHIICLGYDQKINEEDLVKYIEKNGLDIKVVRCKAHLPELFKSSLLK